MTEPPARPPRRNRVPAPTHTAPPGQGARAAIYYRVSTALQAETGVSLETQLAQCQELVARSGWGLAGVWHDVETGRADDRQQYQAMLDAAATWDALVVWKVDRLGRNEAELFRVEQALRRAGKVIVSVNEQISDPLIRGMMFLLSAQESRRIGERVRPAMLTLARKGRHLGRPPYGYTMVDGFLAPAPEQAAVVRAIYAAAAAGQSIAAIARDLNTTGRPPPWRGLWRSATVNGILRNPAYCGWIYREGMDEPVPGEHAPLIERAVWDAVQAGLNERRLHPGPRSVERQLLIGIGRCACGGPLGVTWRSGARRRAYYTCSRRALGTCRQSMIAAGVVEAVVSDWLAGLAAEPVDPAVLLEQRPPPADPAAGQRDALLEQRAGLTRRLGNLVDLRADGSITQEEYLAARARAARAVEAIDEQLSALPPATLPPAVDLATLGPALAAIRSVYDAWAIASTARRRELLRVLCVRVVWDGEALACQSDHPEAQLLLPPARLRVAPYRAALDGRRRGKK